LKIILSRKGFDSSVGGHPNPILPDGTLLSLPIPTSLDNLSYENIQAPNGQSYRQIMDQIGASNRLAGMGAHLDPDLMRGVRPRHIDWLPSLGQIGSAAGHLRNQKVGVGDLFLFYGWFRETVLVNDRLQYSNKSGAHSIFGHLQVDRVLTTALSEVPAWLAEHPHVLPTRASKSTNTIYVASRQLSFAKHLPGAGTFLANKRLILTKPGLSRGRWNLDPVVFRHLSISYHTIDAWKDGYFQSYPRAQEYVIEVDDAAERWAKKLIIDSVATA
jgi:hypothetical protein